MLNIDYLLAMYQIPWIINIQGIYIFVNFVSNPFSKRSTPIELYRLKIMQIHRNDIPTKRDKWFHIIEFLLFKIPPLSSVSIDPSKFWFEQELRFFQIGSFTGFHVPVSAVLRCLTAVTDLMTAPAWWTVTNRTWAGFLCKYSRKLK